MTEHENADGNFRPKADITVAFRLVRNGNSRSFALVSVKSDGDAFRKRANECRDVANGTKDPEARRELRELAIELDGEAEKMDAEERDED